VMASALRPASFAFCGEVADGAITWLCPATYVRGVALPALRSGAAKADRELPPMILHVPVFLSSDVEAVRATMRQHFAFYLRAQNYVAMFAEAGFPEAKDGQWSDAMIDAVAVYGSETAVAERLRGLLTTCADELLVTAVGVGAEPAPAAANVVRFLGELAQG
jgi:alkanesulfonate monooxygenase SsuD/methylene tetrahydromethanopterin reductase-like flavin-dependent oxidoreductase (luciferase family)